MFLDIERVPHGAVDCSHETHNHVPALAFMFVDGQPTCLSHLLALVPVAEVSA